jgi:hypothetical protein
VRALIELCGDVQDGRVFAVPDGENLPAEYRIPSYDPSERVVVIQSADWAPPPVRTLVYKLAYGPMGHASMNEQGRYRYEYAGIR